MKKKQATKKKKNKGKSRTCFWFCGAKHELANCKICWDNQSDKYYRTDKSNI